MGKKFVLYPKGKTMVKLEHALFFGDRFHQNRPKCLLLLLDFHCHLLYHPENETRMQIDVVVRMFEAFENSTFALAIEELCDDPKN